MRKLYGAPMSSSGRSRWMIEETGIDYEYEVVNLRDPDTRARFKAIHPGCKIPFLVDGEVRLFESMAINVYLAERYAPALMPDDVVGRAQALQWSFWALTNLQPEALGFMFSVMAPADQRDEAKLDSTRKGCRRYLDQLEAALTGEYILGDRFTVADVNTGATVNVALRAGVEGGPRVNAWMERLRARPAYQRATT